MPHEGANLRSHAGRFPRPYLLFLGDVREPAYAKTAFGLRDWAADDCIGEHACSDDGVSTGLPGLSPAHARAAGARAMVIGVAPPGGGIPDAWLPHLVEALEAGLDLVSGLHVPLHEVAELRETAARLGRRLIDVRRAPTGIPLANGRRRGGNRVLTVGTDCASGKKYTALALVRSLRARGVPVDFRATGQTGILVAGRGMPMDAVIADFAAGAAEQLSPDAAAGHWDVIEGQGSLLHPAYAGVSLALLHGSQPAAFVVCHEAGRERLLGFSAHAVPSVEAIIEATLLLGRVTSPDIRCAGISLNSGRLAAAAAHEQMQRLADRLGMPVADPMRGGDEWEALVDACVAPAQVDEAVSMAWR